MDVSERGAHGAHQIQPKFRSQDVALGALPPYLFLAVDIVLELM